MVRSFDGLCVCTRCCNPNTALTGARPSVRTAPAGVVAALVAGTVAVSWPTVTINVDTGVATAIGAMVVDGATKLCTTADVQAAAPATTAITVMMANPPRSVQCGTFPDCCLVLTSALWILRRCYSQKLYAIRHPSGASDTRRAVGCCMVSLRLVQFGFVVGNLVFTHLSPQNPTADTKCGGGVLTAPVVGAQCHEDTAALFFAAIATTSIPTMIIILAITTIPRLALKRIALQAGKQR